MKENTLKKEAQIQKENNLNQIVEAVNEDAKLAPDQYLKDSIVPKGGE